MRKFLVWIISFILSALLCLGVVALLAWLFGHPFEQMLLWYLFASAVAAGTTKALRGKS